MKAVMIALALNMVPLGASAEEAVGRSIVGGRPVTLYDDKTWDYVTDAVPGCAVLSPKLSFCGAPDRWVPSAKPTPDAIAAYRYDSLHYGQIIIEDLGLAQGFTLDAVSEFVLDYAERASGAPATVITTEPASLNGIEGRTIVYAFKVSGIETVYANTILVGQNTLLQVITYEIGTQYSETHADLHAEFLAATQVTE